MKFMKFCVECGEELVKSKKFCPGCGYKVSEIIDEVKQGTDSSSFTQETIFEDDVEKQGTPKSSKELGDSLEDSVKQIMIARGFSTETRKKMRGLSQQFNEIDVLAKKGKDVIAIECKNEKKIIGVEVVRDFCSKLADLNIDTGLIIAASSFSSGALGWGSTNPQNIKINFWNGEKLAEEFRKSILGRTGSGRIKIVDCLKPQDTIESYSNLLLKNKESVEITKQELNFHPVYITEFTLMEKFKTPDKVLHQVNKTGTYYVDGLTKEVLASVDDKGIVEISNDEQQRQIVNDVIDYGSHNYVEIERKEGVEKIQQIKPSNSRQDVEFSVKRKISEDSKTTIHYSIRRSREVTEPKQHLFTPNLNSIRVSSKVVYAPKLEIDFDSRGKNYKRIVFPASNVTLVDEIQYCNNGKHKILGKKETYAVCEVCGIAKCEDHILVDEKNMCFCNDHASEELKESKKGPSLKEKFGRFSFKKK